MMVDEETEVENYNKDEFSKLVAKANSMGIFNEITNSIDWQKEQRNEWE